MITYGEYSSSRSYSLNQADMKFTINLTVNTEAGRTLTLPLINSYLCEVGWTHYCSYNFIVHWGDGTSNTITTYNSANRIHVYSTIGTKKIRIYGLCEGFSVNKNDDKLKYISADHFESAIGLKHLDFYTKDYGDGLTSNFVSVSTTLSNVSTLLDLQNGFRGSTMTSIPSGLLDGCINVTNMRAIFHSCLNVSAIPANLLDYNTVLRDTSEMFMWDSLITVIPTDFFKYNTELYGNCGTFAGTYITSIPSGLLDTCTKVFNGSFIGTCSQLTSIPSGLFRYCTQMKHIDSGFTGCVSLTSLPSDLFQYNTVLQGLESTFEGCTGLTAIPAGLFDNIPGGEGQFQMNFTKTFKGCTSLDGNAPDIWTSKYTGDHLYAATECFAGDTGLDNYASIPAAWGGGGA
jgi:hypothetical protein